MDSLALSEELQAAGLSPDQSKAAARAITRYVEDRTMSREESEARFQAQLEQTRQEMRADRNQQTLTIIVSMTIILGGLLALFNFAAG